MNRPLRLAQHLFVGLSRASYSHKLNFLRTHFPHDGRSYDPGLEPLKAPA